MSIGIHLQFTGQCREAFEFYQSLLGGSLEVLTYTESPASQDVPTEWQDKVIHATLVVNNMVLAGVDLYSDQYEPPGGFQLILQLDDEEESNRLFEALAEGGEVLMPVQKTFWSPCYGMLKDRFGMPWEVNCAE